MAVVKRGKSGVPESAEFKALRAEDEGAAAEETLQGTVSRLIKEARDHYESELLEAQIEATDYFYGREFGDEEDGRSKVVSTEVRDAVEAVKPSLLRIFLGSDAVCEFKPRRMDSVALAKQQTESVQYLVREENDGFLELNAVFDDALLRRLGAVKVWWDESTCVEGEKYTGLTLEQVVVLMEQPGVEVISLEPEAQYDESAPATFTVEITRTYDEGKVRFEAIPNEEFWYTPARKLEKSACVVHLRSDMTVSDLVAMGIERKVADGLAGKGSQQAPDALYSARQFSGADERDMESEGDQATRGIMYGEAYIKVDLDDDGIAERRKFQVAGPEFEIIGPAEGEVVSELPFALFTPRALAHMIAGMSLHDLLRDLQRITSQIERGVLNSLALAIENKLIVDDRRVNLADLLNPDILNTIRVNGDPNQLIRELKHQFVGPDAMPVLEYYQEKRQERTGITKARQGLDADSLQSSTKQAVAGTFQAAQERIEMIARMLAETGMKPLFKLVAKLLVRHQDRPMVVRLQGNYVEVDPRSWNANMDVVVNVGLGSGSFEERKEALLAVIADQNEQMLHGSPLVTWQHLRASRARLLEMTGFKNVDEFYRPWGPQEDAQYQQAQTAAQQQAPSDPNVLLAQVEQAKIAQQAQIAQMKMQMQMQADAMKQQFDSARLELERLKITLLDDREREKIARESALKEHEIELTNQREIDDSQLQAQIAADRASMGGAEE